MAACSVCGGKTGFMMSVCDSCIAEQNQRSLAEGRDLEAVRRREEVQLERQLKAVTLTTTPSLDGFRVLTTLDVICAEYVFKPTVLRDIASALLDVPINGSASGTQRALSDARTICLRELRRVALGIGANAVLGVSLNYSEFTGHGNAMVVLLATGTAVTIERVTP